MTEWPPPEALTAWRARLGLNRLDAARALGMSRQSLADYENGVHRIPPHVGLAAAALARGIKGLHRSGLPIRGAPPRPSETRPEDRK
jgi:transcriptional regulator with XRE-family HTH domain